MLGCEWLDRGAQKHKQKHQNMYSLRAEALGSSLKLEQQARWVHTQVGNKSVSHCFLGGKKSQGSEA